MASAEDVRTLNISTNCKTISARLDGAELGVALNTIQKIYIYDQAKLVNVYLETTDFTESNNIITFTKSLSDSVFKGVISVELHTSGTIDYTPATTTLATTVYTVAPCQIDCCIAKLTDAAIECHCKCDKCKEDLLRAEKIMLMLQGATFAAEQESNYDHAVNMYNKADALCTEVCACGC